MVHFQGAHSPLATRASDHYKTLGLPTAATFAEIQRAYWRLAFGGMSVRERVALNEAYDVLGNDLRRREYDGQRGVAGMDEADPTSGTRTSQTAPRSDAGLRGKLGWPSA